MFQSRTGFPGHLARVARKSISRKDCVSIPNGLPRPFSHAYHAREPGAIPVSIPNGLPRPFSLWCAHCIAHAALPFQSRTGFPGHLAFAPGCSQASDRVVSIPNGLPRPFSPRSFEVIHCFVIYVSIPNGLPRPFSP